MQEECGCVWHSHCNNRVRHYTIYCETAQHLIHEADLSVLIYESIAQNLGNVKLSEKAYDAYRESVEIMMAHFSDDPPWIKIFP